VWSATAIDGSEHDSETALTFERVNERGGARSLRVGEIRAACSPEAGESLHLFTRRAIVNVGTTDARQVDMPVIELRRAGSIAARLYLHPDHGPIFSTLDLNL
jgi:hypothetical protein